MRRRRSAASGITALMKSRAHRLPPEVDSGTEADEEGHRVLHKHTKTRFSLPLEIFCMRKFYMFVLFFPAAWFKFFWRKSIKS